MEKIINNYYNIKIDKIIEKNYKYYFSYESNTFYFIPYNRSLEEIKDIYLLHLELLKKNIGIHEIVINKDNMVLTKVGETYYILLKEKIKNETISLKDMFLFNNNLISQSRNNLVRDSWTILWQSKIDYIEYQISELTTKKNIITNSVNYYIGLAENAIQYVNTLKGCNNEIICLQHRRIDFPNTTTNYLNPLNLVFDYEVRDYAEYLKIKFLKGSIDWEEIYELFNLKVFTSYAINLFMARLLFPNYYFDIYEEVMNNNRDEKDLLPIINRVEEYEKFLKDIYSFLNKKTNLIFIDWLNG